MKQFWGGLLLLVLGLGALVLMVVCMVEDMSFAGCCLMLLGIICLVGGYGTMKGAVAQLKEQLNVESQTGEKTTRRKITLNILVSVCVLLVIGTAALLINASICAADLNSYVSYALKENAGSQDLAYLEEIDQQVAKYGPIVRGVFYRYDDEVQVRKNIHQQAICDRAAEITAGIAALEECTQLRSKDHYIQLSSEINKLKLMDSDEFTYQVRALVTNYGELAEHEAQLETVRNRYRHICNECKGNGDFTCTRCGGGGSRSCDSCGGYGKKTVTWYSNGDWGEKSYTSYECTSCGGSGRRGCGSCNGGKIDCSGCDSGYIYIYEDELSTVPAEEVKE